MITNDFKSGVSVPIDFELTTTKTEQRVDTRLMARHLGTKHKNTFELLKANQADFEQLGKVPFQTEALPSGQSEKFGLLNEDQTYLLLTYSRNTAKVRALKVKLVLAFREARRAAEVRQGEYLPAYHALHDAIRFKAAGSANERFIHMNANKVMNQLAGVQAGHRVGACTLKQSLLAVGAALAAKAVLAAQDSHDLHQHIKIALKPLEGLLALAGESEVAQ